MAIIGITLDFKAQDEQAHNSGLLYMQRKLYSDIVHAAGHNLIILPYVNLHKAQAGLIGKQIALIDALIIPGGNKFVAKDASSNITLENLQHDQRSQYEVPLLNMALAKDIPILGICWGMQLLNLLMGGSLHAQIADVNTHNQQPPFNKPVHNVQIKPTTKLHSIVGLQQAPVNSSHTQAVNKLGQGVIANASAADGPNNSIIEGIESTQHKFALGVQWHPEYNSSPLDAAIFKAFFNVL